jgi:hypothetical protein
LILTNYSAWHQQIGLGVPWGIEKRTVFKLFPYFFDFTLFFDVFARLSAAGRHNWRPIGCML